VAGPSTSAQVFFSSGADNLGNNNFVGLAGVSGNEGAVVQIVALPATYTSMACYINSITHPALTFTIKINFGAVGSTLNCTIPANTRSGSCGGCGSATVVAGDVVDVATPASGTPSVAGSFALAP
jgi:hypothetical protein